MNVKKIDLKIIFDSRGKETLEAEIVAEKFSAKASVPAGKSTGSHEAFVLEPQKAVEKFKKIVKPEILLAIASGKIKTQRDFDNFLISLDGTLNKQNLGGNLILALSLAFARYKAKSENLELYKYIQNQFTNPPIRQLTNSRISRFPRPIFNVINGGAHAKNKLSIQEFQVIPQVNDFAVALSLGMEFYRKLGNVLEKKFGKENIFLGDEAGYSAPFETNEEAIETLYELIKNNHYPFKIGLDAAATSFFKKQEYVGGRQGRNKNGAYVVDGKNYLSGELAEYYGSLVEKYEIIAIEDPFFEEGFDDFKKMTEKMKPLLVITDDLTTTNLERFHMALSREAGNAILIKLNQIGTLTETLDVVKMAYENNWKAVVSHRSGETMDDFIADLAVAINAWGIKAGAPGKPERMAKYDRLLEIRNKK